MPRSVRMTEEERAEFLNAAHTGILTTLKRDGNPVSLPLWFIFSDGNIYSETWGKKLGRIRRDPRASFLVEDGTYWRELKAVHFVGEVTVLDDDSEEAASAREELNATYDRYRTPREQMPGATQSRYGSVEFKVIRFTPTERPLHWDNSHLFEE